MTLRERLLAAYRGQAADRVAVLADLSWWYAGHTGGKFIPGHADGANQKRIPALLELHRQIGVAIHLNLGVFYTERHSPDIRVQSGIRGEEYFHRFETPVGTVEEVRQWSDSSFSWPIVHHMVQNVEDLKVIRHIFEHIEYGSRWDAFAEIQRQVGDLGVVLAQAPYTGMGFLMSRYAGVEHTVMLAMDEPDQLQQTVEVINAAHERVFRLLAEGPAEVLFNSDNLSSDVQSPPWFERYSGGHYRTMATIARSCGKPLITHIDGRLRGLLRATAQAGISGADAVTPAPWGDLTPQQCRDEAGPDYVLSGGVPPDSFKAQVPLKEFDRQVEAWLELRRRGPALIIAPGDPLQPDGELQRVQRMALIAEAWR